MTKLGIITKLKQEKALLEAVENGNTDLVIELLQANINIETTDNRAKTSLMIAAQFGRTNIVDILLKKGAKTRVISKKGWTPFTLAVCVGPPNVDTIVALLDHGVDLEFGHNGVTALLVAARGGNFSIRKMLLGKGANQEASSKTNAWASL